ncbi:MAG: response regulator transcription factor [Coriobacteriaceae bacterium]|jgi:two-component system response regulator VicR|nr:response regulator transcription factor [Coriobacteriaceae bacterium]
MRILYVDDDEQMRTLIECILTKAGYESCAACDGLEALEKAASWDPDLIIMDVMMPNLNGFEACERLREGGVRTPIIFLSAKGDIVDKGVGFAAGADDYLVKPFSPEELVMRVQAHLRQYDRLSDMQAKTIREGGLLLDLRCFRAFVEGKEALLTPTEFRILAYLAQRKGEIVTREQLIKEVWGTEFVGETSSVTVFIRKIREKIEADPSRPQLIKTRRNVGYIFGMDG